MKQPISRRDFLKLAGVGLGALAMKPFPRFFALPEFPNAERLGRNCTGGKIPIKTLPDVNSPTVKEVYEDTVFPWLKEVIAPNPDYNRINQRWVETPEGYVYASYLQPVRNLQNTPLTTLPEGKTGFWAEVTVPYVDLVLDNPPPRSPAFKYLIENRFPTRLYYSQVVWIDQVSTNESGLIIYRFNENGGRPEGVTGGSYGDIFWADAAAFRPLSEEELAPISPDVDPNTKKIIVNVTYQTLSCMEGDREVYFCQVSTGVGDNATPVGDGFTTWRKTLSIHMAAGTVDAGYDTPGVSWVTFFMGTGVAIHATYWHNQFGEKRSHGCVNCRPEDAKWIFRWTTPVVSLSEGDLTWSDWIAGSTHIDVYQRLW